MANLLDLVDQLIGDVLAGNVFTNNATYLQSVGPLPAQVPYPAQVDPRLLNFQETNPHPHAGKVGLNPKQHVIPEPVHDNRGDFLDSTPRSGPVAAQTPAAKRAAIYQPETPRPDVGQQIDTSRLLPNTPIARDLIYKSPPIPPTPEDQRVVTDTFTPLSREDVYRNPVGSTNPVVSPVHQKNIQPHTLGDQKSVVNQPPASSLNFQGPKAGDVPDLTTIQGNLTEGVVKTPLETRARSLLQDVTKSSKRDEFAPLQGLIGKDFNEAHRLGNLYDDGDVRLISSRGGKFAVESYGLLRTLDIFAIAHWFRGIGRDFGLFPIQDNNVENKVQRPSESVTKGITWLVSQFLLTSFNKGDPQAYGITNQIWNPLSLVASLVPIRVSHPGTNITIGSVLGDYKANTRASIAASPGGVAAPGVGERLLLMRQGMYSEIAPVHRLSQIRSPIAKPGFMGDLSRAGEYDTLQQEKLPGPGSATVEAQVDGGLKGAAAAKAGLHTNPYNSNNPYNPVGGTIAPLHSIEALPNPGIEKIKALFDAKTFPGGQVATLDPNFPIAGTFMAKALYARRDAAPSLADLPGTKAATTDAFFTTQAGTDEAEGTFATNPIPEDQIYMPFMFQDLRDPTEQFLYFRAFLKGDLTETFTPDWQTERYYGRVDEIPIYMGTGRIINVSFDVVAWSPADLPVIYKKLHKLQSMVYPTYNDTGFMQNGPIIKMRIGDLIAGENNRGIPGYITSLDFSYDDGIWNIQPNLKVPRKISVSLSYTVLHDGNPGIYPYASADIAPDGGIVKTGNRTFGAGKFVRNDDGTFTATVSISDIRKIFGQVRGV